MRSMTFHRINVLGIIALALVSSVADSAVVGPCLFPAAPAVLPAQGAPAERDVGAPDAASMPEAATAVPAAPSLPSNEYADLSAVSAARQTRTLGTLYETCQRTEDPAHYKYQIELTSLGAAVASVTFSEFDDRHHKDPKPLKLMGPVADNKKILYPLACQNLKVAPAGETRFSPSSFPLDKLNWKIADDSTPDQIRFEAIVEKKSIRSDQPARTPVLRLVKTFHLQPGSYDLACEIAVENLTDRDLKIQFDLAGPSGIEREAIRMEDRKIIGGFLDPKGAVVSARKEMVAGSFAKTLMRQVGLRDSSESYRQAIQSGNEQALREARYDVLLGRNLSGRHKPAKFLWVALVNKYFAAILRPVPQEGQTSCDWIGDQTAWYHNPDNDKAANSGDENVSTVLSMMPIPLAPAGSDGAVKRFDFQFYLGPKDRHLFGKTPLYKQLGYFFTIDFGSCCCPSCMIRPLAFGILWSMKAMYNAMGPLGNYGIVIMILVVVVRLLLHPITKKSQVSMSAMQKVAPQIDQLRTRYANDPMEMQRKIREVYRESGVNPTMSIVPIMLQMPIWIALWSAVDSSIDLRGAGFLPFWITDLSAPDAVIRFREMVIPLLGWHIDSINLLPLLMGVVMYVQQKMTPSAAAQSNPQMAQQQKMMMIMMPILFPIMLYKGPSGVNLYIMSSMAAGVVEQMVIKKHIEQRDALKAQGLVPATSKTGGKVKKPKSKPLFRINR